MRRTLADGTERVYHYPAYRPKRYEGKDTIDGLIAAWQRSPTWRALAQSTRIMYARAIKPLSRMGGARADTIDLRDLVIVRDAIAEAIGNGAATVFVRTASAMFGWAVENGFLKSSPTYKLKRLPGGHLPAWSDADVALALQHLPEHLRRPLILALYTGQRRGDLIRLRWSDYDGKRIKLEQEKTDKPLVVPCHPLLIEAMEAWRKDRVIGIASAPILLNAHGRQWRGNTLSSELTTALGKIEGFPSRHNIHGLRKLAAANLAQAGCSLHEIAAITGHKSLAMIQLYTASVDQERLAEAAICKLYNRPTNGGKLAE